MSKYSPTERIREGRYTVVSRGRRDDGVPVVLKQLRALYPSPDTMASLQREFDLTARAAGDKVIRVHELHSEEGLVQLVLEDFGASSLAEQFERRRPDLDELLRIAIDVVDALATLHDRHIIHKDVNPANIVRNPATEQLKLIDFGISSILRREAPDPQPVRHFQGTPRYMSPEQTGRMNVPLDYRTDFYSLGATLYELATGRPPFESAERLELVHAHIARSPTAPRAIDPAIPESVSALILTLLAKRAEDRYQSARGIRADLTRCLDQLRDTGRADRVLPFELRTADSDERLHVPQRLYGRGDEIAALVSAFERASTGATEVLLVAGYSGIGKTSLVSELHKSLAAARRGHFVRGKFDQFNRGIPYASLSQAFRGFVREILAEPESVVAAWRAEIAAAVGQNGRVITDLVSEVELLIGDPPPLEAVPAAEAENRLAHTFLRFVGALASAEHPLVVFLDDLQWADTPSLRLLEAIAGDRSVGHLMLIGAYRDNEVGDAHPLRRTVAALGEAGVTVRTLQLGPLTLEHVSELLSDTVGRRPASGEPGARGDGDPAANRTAPSEQEVRQLAGLCLAKTGGNAFFLNRFLETLHARGLLRLDPERRRWTWDPGAVEAEQVTDNVVDLMTAVLRALGDDARRAVIQAAVIGSEFDLDRLALIGGVTRFWARVALQGALEAELVLPTDEAYWDGGNVTPNFSYRFQHDRIQQAAYTLLDAQERARLHLELGRAMLRALPEDEIEEQLFQLVEHLDQGKDLVTDRAERDRLSDLNLRAGVRALDSAAFVRAHQYLEVAVELAGADVWERRHPAALTLFTEAARAAYLAGEPECMARRVAEIHRRAANVLERVPARELEILASIGGNDLLGAIGLARETLAELGVTLPEEPTPAAVEQGLGATLAVIGPRDGAELVALPDGSDPTIAAAMRLQIDISSAAYLVQPLLVPLLSFNLVRASVEHGVMRQSAYGFGLFALFLSAVKMCDLAMRHGEVALGLVTRFGDRTLRTRPAHLVYGFVHPWNMPLRDTLHDMISVYDSGVDTGDIEYACWGAHMYCGAAFYSGTELKTLAGELDTWCGRMTHYRQIAQLHVTVQFVQAVKNLRGEADDPTRLVGRDFDETQALATYLGMKYRGAVFVLSAMQVKCRYLFGDVEGCLAAAELATEYEDGAVATMHVVTFRFYGALAALAMYERSTDEAERARLLARYEERRAPFEVWNRFCPANHAHRIALLDAERARVARDVATALRGYEDAIRLARENHYEQHVALACERAGRFHLGRGAATPGRAYLLEARFAYQGWGAGGKVAALDREFPELATRALATQTTVTQSGKTGSSSVTSTGSEGAEALDFESLLKASNLLTSEIRLSSLLGKVMQVVLEAAGATRGYLVMDHEGALRVDAARDADGDTIAEAGIEVRDCPRLPQSVIAYVARTGERLVLEDALADPRFRQDPALASLSGRVSLLCAPVVHQGKRSGMVLLANHLAAGAFTSERVRMVELLTTQAAIAIANARLYEESKRMARSFERFVPKGYLAALGREKVSDVALGDAALREATVLFSDLRGFTRLFEALEPRAGVALLNDYLGRMSPIIEANGGFVDKFVGDAIMALFFGVTDRALAAVIQMAAALRERNRATGGALLVAGSALHAGPVLMGTIGSVDRLDVTSNGDVVNTAARLEAATKALGTPILISGEVMRRLNDPRSFDLRPLGAVRFYGRAEPLQLVEVFSADPEPVRVSKRATAAVFGAAQAAFRAGDFEAARAGLEACVSACPADTVATLLRDRAEQALRGGLQAATKGDVEFV